MSAPASASDLVAALGGRHGMARCPAHDDRTPSLSIRETPEGRLLVHCFGGCEQQQVVSALQDLGLWLGRASDGVPVRRASPRPQPSDAFKERLWRETWKIASPDRGSPVESENWFRARGIDLDAAELDRMPLRWTTRCPRGADKVPAMVALMTDAVTGEPCGIHRTFLLPDGSAKAFGKESRKMLGHAGVIRLSPDDEVELGLGIAEGVETALAIMAAGWRPIWACGSLGALAAFPVLSGIECLTVFADPKPHEICGARACARRWAEAGREAIVRIPGNGDWNDALAAT